MSETNKSPQPCELFLVKPKKWCFWCVFFYTYYTVEHYLYKIILLGAMEKLKYVFNIFFKNMLNQTVDLAHNG